MLRASHCRIQRGQIVWSAPVPPVRNLRPGYTIDFPNRHKAASKATKSIVILLLIVSVVLMLIVTLGGWSKLQGLKAVNLAWAAVYVIMAVYIARWNRGLLPIASALAILLLILTVIAGTGVSGTSWFDRSHAGLRPGGLDLRWQGTQSGHARPGHDPDRPRPGVADLLRDARLRPGLERRGRSARGPGQAREQVLRRLLAEPAAA